MPSKPANAEPKPRRRFQYGLRLAVLLLTLACSVGGWIGWQRYTALLKEKMREAGRPGPYAQEKIRREQEIDRLYRDGPSAAAY
jgi:hypothetical protein